MKSVSYCSAESSPSPCSRRQHPATGIVDANPSEEAVIVLGHTRLIRQVLAGPPLLNGREGHEDEAGRRQNSTHSASIQKANIYR